MVKEIDEIREGLKAKYRGSYKRPLNDRGWRMWEKHPAEDFLIATREERALRLADMPPMVSILPGDVPALLRRAMERQKILPFWRPSEGEK